MKLVSPVEAFADGTWPDTGIVLTASVAAGATTATFSSQFITAKSIVTGYTWQSDPGVNAGVVVTTITPKVEGNAENTSQYAPGTIAVKIYGTTTAAATLAINVKELNRE